MPAWLQFGGSLLAVTLLALASRALGLGRTPRLCSEAEACELAGLALVGFRPVSASVDRQGRGALLRDGEGRVALVVPFGAHFAARMLGPGTQVRLTGDGALQLRTSDPFFVRPKLELGPAAVEWARAIASLGVTR